MADDQMKIPDKYEDNSSHRSFEIAAERTKNSVIKQGSESYSTSTDNIPGGRETWGEGSIGWSEQRRMRDINYENNQR